MVDSDDEGVSAISATFIFDSTASRMHSTCSQHAYMDNINHDISMMSI
jgi:hypothetical protein